MRLQIINVAQKMPPWADAACEDYSRRLPPELKPEMLTLFPASRRPNQPVEKLLRQESELILGKLEPGSYNLALDERGEQWTSREWSRQLQQWMLDYPRVNLIIGGPDGLAPECLQACQRQIALGPMTLPHALAKVILLEQLYRAWSILRRHPYHRE